MIVMFAMMIFLFLCNFMSMGIIGEFFSNLMFGLTGFLAYFLPVVVFALYLYYILMEEVDPKIVSRVFALIGLCLIVTVFLEMAGTDLSQQTGYDPVGIYARCSENRSGGGLIGGTIAFILYSLLKTVGMVIVLIVLAIVCIYVIGQRSFLELFRDKAKDARKARRERLEEEARYRRDHPEEFEDEYDEDEEYDAASYEEQKPAEDGEVIRKRPAESRSGKVRRRKPIQEEIGAGESAARQEVSDDGEDVRHFRGIVGNTDLSASEGFEGSSGGWNATASDMDLQDETYESEAAAGMDAVPAAESYRELSHSEELHEIRPEDYQEDEELPDWKAPFLEQTERRSPVSDWKELTAPVETDPSDRFGGEMSVSKPAEDAFVVELSVDEPDAEELSDPETAVDESAAKASDADDVVAAEETEEILPEIPVHTEREEGTSEINLTLEEQAYEEPAACAQETEQEKGGAERAKNVQNRVMPNHPKEYVFPPIELLHPGKGSSADSYEELRRTAQTLQSTLASFGVKVRITDISQGPSVTRYEMLPETGVKVSRIVSLADDIKLALAATDIRIEAPIPGKSAIGIEVPNRESQPVMLRDIVDCPEFRGQKSRLAFAVGKDIAGRPVYSDIAKMPHVLIAGATGAGKSVCINTIIMSILYHARPDEVKFIMVDPKVVELSVYNGIPHLLIPVVTNPQKATAALNWAVSEMEARYRAFADARVRDISSYNAMVKEKEAKGELPEEIHFMPQIVVIVDELADLMMVAKNDVETAICRLAQLARAAGIHLIIATQRPSVDVITGLIKANMPSRIAFRVSSGVDSRTILDMVGAEKLLGRGDMLFYPQGLLKPTRIQGCFVSDEEVNDVASFLIRSSGSSEEEQQRHQEEIDALEAQGSTDSAAGVPGGSSAAEPAVDELFGSAGAFIIEKNNASIGLLQRRFRIGFNRAARIMDQLCGAGVVSESEGTKSRNVLMTPAEFMSYCSENGIRIPEQT